MLYIPTCASSSLLFDIPLNSNRLESVIVFKILSYFQFCFHIASGAILEVVFLHRSLVLEKFKVHRESRLVRAVGDRSHVLSELSNSCKLEHLNKELNESINAAQKEVFKEDQDLVPIYKRQENLFNPQNSFVDWALSNRDITTDDILANMGSEDFEV